MLKKFLPKETGFYEFFDQQVKLIIEGCEELKKLTHATGSHGPYVVKIKEIEHAADEVTHRCIEALHKTFITPIERSEIHNLIRGLDDIIDSVDAACSRISLYEIKEIRTEAKALADVLVRASYELEKSLTFLRNVKNENEMKEICIKIHQLENEGDTILRAALMRLFKEEKDPILVIKWKEIFERLERATDHCEDVSNILEGVILEST